MSVWTPPALQALREEMPWEEFSRLFPTYSYDAWEVKRRRVDKNGSFLVSAPAVSTDEYIGPTICFWDLETTYSTQPRILSGAGVDGFGSLTVFDQRDYCDGNWMDDRPISLAIRDYLQKFTIIAGWNSKLFDVPVLNGRLSYWKEAPLVAQMHVDLMYYATGQFVKIGRKSLESVSAYFDSPHRKTPLSPRLWDKADHGDMDAYNLILEHNIADVRVTRDVWAHLSPYIRQMHRAG